MFIASICRGQVSRLASLRSQMFSRLTSSVKVQEQLHTNRGRGVRFPNNNDGWKAR